MTETAKREMTFLLAGPEKRLLTGMARRLPSWIHSDHLTVLGVIAAFGVGVSYALSVRDPAWLWLASAMFVVNWFGDSLDGTVARVRHLERPRYGYYLDHGIDSFTTVLIAGGLGLSPYVHIEYALLLVVLYLMLSINVYLESAVRDVFHIAYGRVGPTEMRILGILGNTALFFAPALLGERVTLVPTIANGVVLGAAALMFAMWTTRFFGNLRELGRQEPLGGSHENGS